MKQRAKKPADTPSTDPSTAGRSEPTQAATKRPGRRKGDPRNTGGSKDPEWTLAMKDAQVDARRNRRRRLAGHMTAARRIVAECDEGSPLVDRTATRLAQVEHEIGELGFVVERVGRVKRDGTLNPSYERRLNLIAQDRAELRQLVDKLIELKAAQPKVTGPVEYRICNPDGSDFDFGFGDGASRPVLADRAAGVQLTEQAPRPRLEPHVTPLPAHPLDAAAPKGEPVTVTKPAYTIETTATTETPLQRNWRLGLDPYGNDYDD